VITPHPTENKVTIDVSMIGLSVCFGSDSAGL
jgi:hypothetical protein